MIRLLSLKAILWTLFLSSTFLVAAQDDQTDDAAAPSTSQTPLRPVSISDIELTPGQLASNLQAQFFKKENFTAVLGVELVDSWGMDWKLLENPTISFADPIRISAMSQLHVRLANLARRRTDESFLTLHSRFLLIRDRIMIVHADRLDTLALAYFSKLFPNASLTPKMKLGGVQLGERIIVAQAGQPLLTYHVKTHSAGKLSSNSEAAKIVNSQELMVYRILENLGIGCQSHFFERSPEDVYISTLDAGVRFNSSLRSFEEGRFFTFEHYTKHIEAGSLIWGSLVREIGSEHPIGRDMSFVDQNTTSDERALHFFHEMTKLDLLSRILRLPDTLNNSGNFGFAAFGEELPMLRLIDFRVTEPREWTPIRIYFGALIKGNGFFRYDTVHHSLSYALRYRDRSLRMKTSLEAMSSEPLCRLEQAIDKAAEETALYIMEHPTFAQHTSAFLGRIAECKQDMIQNAQFFRQKLARWTPDQPDSCDEDYRRVFPQQ